MRTCAYDSHSGQILVVTVGLPGRGKTHLAHAIQRYLRWMGVKCQVYNLANTRREILGRIDQLPQDYFGERRNNDTVQLHQQVTERLEAQIEGFFEHGGQVAVYDAYNSNQERRTAVQRRFEAMNVQLMFIGTCTSLIAECQCDDEEMIERNIRSMHTFNPDFEGWDLDKVFQHLRERIAQHEILYEPITDRSCPHVQLLNLGQRIVVNHVHGYLQNRIVLFLMNMHSRERMYVSATDASIYFARVCDPTNETGRRSARRAPVQGRRRLVVAGRDIRRTTVPASDESAPTPRQDEKQRHVAVAGTQRVVYRAKWRASKTATGHRHLTPRAASMVLYTQTLRAHCSTIPRARSAGS